MTPGDLVVYLGCYGMFLGYREFLNYTCSEVLWYGPDGQTKIQTIQTNLLEVVK